MQRDFLLQLLAVLLSCLSAAALFEDQVGKFDWLIQHLGPIKWSRFLNVNGKSQLIFASEVALALANSQDGSIIWRKVFEEQDGDISKIFLFDGNSNIATLHEKRQLYRVFDCLTGNMRQELSLVPETGALETITDTAVSRKQPGNVMVVSKTSMRAISFDETSSWTYPLSVDSDDFVSRKIRVNEAEKTVDVVSLYNSGVSVMSFELAGGDKLEDIRRNFEFSQDSCNVEGDFIVCLADDSLKFLKLDGLSGKKSTNFVSSKLGFKISSVESVFGDLFLVHFKESTATTLVELSETKTETIKHFENFVSYNELSVPYATNGALFAFLHSEKDSLTVTAINCEAKTEMFSNALKVRIHEKHGNPLLVAAATGKSSGRPDKVFITAEDQKTFMIGISSNGQNSILWTKDESLSQVIDVEMCDLNLSEAMITLEADFEFATRAKTTLFEMFYRRFSSHISQFVGFAMKTYDQIANQQLFKECAADKDELVRDSFNVNKMLIVLSGNGKLSGILSASGKIMWSLWFRDMTFKKSISGQVGSFLFVQRGTDNYKFEPKAVLVGQNKVSGNVAIIYFNPLSGQVIESSLDTGYKALQVISIPEVVTDDNLKSFAFLMEDRSLKLYPDTPANVNRFDRIFSKALFVVLTASNERIAGVQFDKVGTGKELWSHSLGIDHEVYGIYSMREGELVDSPGKVQSDQTVLFKYLNPNLVFVVLSPKQKEVGDSAQSGNDAKFQFEFSLIDSVSGETVFATTMRRVSDIHVVHSENWVVFSVWNDKSRRTELTVIELYESGKDSERNSTHFSSFANSSAPLVLRQSYIYPAFVKSLATTYSEKGLTNKQVILGTASGALVPIPKHLLDPRRSLTSKAAAREEGMIPYHPVISLPLEMNINYNQSIALIRGSVAFPGGLESTVLLFNYGLDIFFTQVFPSEMFDVLSADFEFWIIGAVCSALFIGSLVTKKLSSYYALKKAWK